MVLAVRQNVVDVMNIVLLDVKEKDVMLTALEVAKILVLAVVGVEIAARALAAEDVLAHVVRTVQQDAIMSVLEHVIQIVKMLVAVLHAQQLAELHVLDLLEA